MSMYNSLLLISSLSVASASPLYIIKPHNIINKRELTTGTKAGLGVGIAVAVILVVLISTFLIIHFRDNKATRREHAAQTATIEKNTKADGSDSDFGAADEPGPSVTALPKRQKSVKDRLMGPLYRGSAIDMVPMPPNAKFNQYTDAKRQSALNHLESQGSQESYLDKPWSKSGNRTPIPSFSSKRATRMMMMM